MEDWQIGAAIYSVMTADFILIGIISFYAIKRRSLNKYLYFLAAIFALGQGIMLYFFTTGMEFTNISFLMVLLIMILAWFTVSYLATNFNLYRILNGESRGVLISLVVFSVLIVLSITYGIGKDYWSSYRNEKRPTWSGFLTNFLLFIPCMMYDFAEYFTEEWMHTRMPILFLVFVEIMVILAYVFGKSWFKNCEKTLLLPQPVFLNRFLTISDSQPMTIENIVNKENPTAGLNIRKDYAFTMWIYINDYTSNNDFIEKNERSMKQIFFYGNANKKDFGGNPQIFYHNRQLVYDFSNTRSQEIIEKTDYKHDILLQKWNHVALNYKMNEVDLFINGKLIYTHSLTNMPVYDFTHVVQVGDDQGIDGAISNVYFHNKPLSRMDIAYEYNIGWGKPDFSP